MCALYFEKMCFECSSTELGRQKNFLMVFSLLLVIVLLYLALSACTLLSKQCPWLVTKLQSLVAAPHLLCLSWTRFFHLEPSDLICNCANAVEFTSGVSDSWGCSVCSTTAATNYSGYCGCERVGVHDVVRDLFFWFVVTRTINCTRIL